MMALPIGLTAVAAALCLAIAGELSGLPAGDPFPVAANRPPAASPNKVLASETPNRQAWVEQTTARPLFSPDRRPVEVGVSGLPRLTGIVVAGSQRVAIFAAPGNQHPIVAQSGTRVGAYEVQAIADAGVTVAGPEGTTLIRPIFDVVRPATSQAAPAPAARPQAARPGTR